LKAGREAEQLVLEAYLKRGYQLRAKNFKSPFGEIDLWLVKGHKDLLVEVKTLKSAEHLSRRVTRGQVSRLQRILIWAAEQAVHVRLRVVYVTPDAAKAVDPAKKFIDLGIEALV
jgi:Holliday junction resolvase-like predicted endonuclease